MSRVTPHPSRTAPARDERRRFRLGAPVVTLLLVAAIATIWALRTMDDPRARTGMKISVQDGDSFRAGPESYRLINIDAPELHQTCTDANRKTWSCGIAARDRLTAISLRGGIACTPRGQDRFGRTLAHCSARGIKDIGETLVREGLALDFGHGAGTYYKAERIAREAKAGIWAGAFERPQDWRRKHPRS
jgi:endonuclease YncB( thermonuclease family)